ncbi:MAG: hypothetical protein WDO73_12745 [Ignavibacteriota bacterium]
MYRATGSISRVEQEYQSAAAIIDREHSRLRQDESKFAFLSSLVEFYRRYVDFLVGRGDDQAHLGWPNPAGRACWKKS